MAEQLTPEEIQRVFDEYNEELLRTGKVSGELREAFANAKIGIKDYTYYMNQNLKNLGSSALSMGKALKEGAQGASVYNDTIEASAKALSLWLEKIPVFGKYLAAAATATADYVQAVNKQSDKLFENYQQLSRFGAANAQGMKDVFETMQSLNYNIDAESEKFVNLIRTNSESFALMGGTVNQGVKAFSTMAERINRTGLDTEFRLLGMTADQINEGMAGYLRIQTLSGTAQRKTTAELAQGSADYLKQLDLITKITGKNAEAQQAEAEARLTDQRYIGVTLELRKKAEDARARGDETTAKRYEDQYKANEAILQSVPKEAQKGIQDLMTGFAGTKEAQQAMRLYGSNFTNMLMRQQYTVEEGYKGLGQASQNAGRVMKDFSGQMRSGNFEEVFGSAAAGMKMQSKEYSNALQSASDQQVQQVLAGEKAVKGQVAMRQDQSEVGRAMQSFVNLGINPTTTAMQKLTGAIESVVTKIPGTGAKTGTSGTGRGGEINPLFGGSSVRGTGTTSRENSSQLLDIIGRGESRGNYNALVGGKNADLTNMTIDQVQELQKTMTKANGFASSAVGKYQMISSTLAEQAKKAGLDTKTAKFDQKTQDLLATQLIDQAGLGKKNLPTVMKNLAGTWASLPMDMTGKGRYDGYNTNKSNIDPKELANAIVGKTATAANKQPEAKTATAANKQPEAKSDTAVSVAPRSNKISSAEDIASFYGIKGPSSGLNLLSGPKDQYKPTVAGIGPEAPLTSEVQATGSSTQAPAANTNDLLTINITKQEEIITLMKTNNSQNQKILQAYRS